MFIAAEQTAIVIKEFTPPLKNQTPAFYKVAHFALRFFKTVCLFVGGLAVVALLQGWLISPHYISPLSLKVFALAVLCYVGIKVFEKTLDNSSDKDMKGLIEDALEYADLTQGFTFWKQNLADHSILNPFIYRACQAAQITYRPLEGLQSEWEV